MMFSRVLRDDEVPIYGEGNHQRSFTFIDDVTGLICDLLDNETPRRGFVVGNIGNPDTHSLGNAWDCSESVAPPSRGCPRWGSNARTAITHTTDKKLVEYLGKSIRWTPLPDIGKQLRWAQGVPHQGSSSGGGAE